MKHCKNAPAFKLERKIHFLFFSLHMSAVLFLIIYARVEFKKESWEIFFLIELARLLALTLIRKRKKFNSILSCMQYFLYLSFFSVTDFWFFSGLIISNFPSVYSTWMSSSASSFSIATEEELTIRKIRNSQRWNWEELKWIRWKSNENVERLQSCFNIDMTWGDEKESLEIFSRDFSFFLHYLTTKRFSISWVMRYLRCDEEEKFISAFFILKFDGTSLI